MRSLDDPKYWLEIDPRPDEQARIVKLRESLLDPNQKYFNENFAAEPGTVDGQTEVLYMILAELIRWQRVHPTRVEFDFEYAQAGTD